MLILKYKKPDETADNEIKEEKIKEKKKKKKKKLLESRDENGKVLKKKKKKKKKNKDMVTNNDQPVDKPTGRIDLKRKCDFDEDEPASWVFKVKIEPWVSLIGWQFYEKKFKL